MPWAGQTPSSPLPRVSMLLYLSGGTGGTFTPGRPSPSILSPTTSSQTFQENWGRWRLKFFRAGLMHLGREFSLSHYFASILTMDDRPGDDRQW